MPTNTNAEVDTAAAAVPAPYGPLTRVTNLDDDLPTPNDTFLIELTDQDDNTVYAHYYELTDPERILEIVAEANGFSAVMHGAVLELDSILTDFPEAGDGLYSYSDYIAFVERLRSLDIVRNFL
jgi:hypothetical protein